MIQRIQTLFLALSAGLLGTSGILPFAQTEAISSSAYFKDGIYQASDHPLLIILYPLSAILAVAAIFLFRKRPLQLRMTMFAAIAGILAGGCTILFFWQDSNVLAADLAIQDGVGAYLPLPGLVFLALAYRFIGKDEKLVRSMDRLR